MCDSEINRRAFTAASIAAGAVMGAAWSASAQAKGVKATDVSIKTPDGETDAALYTPAGKGPFPGVLIFTDIFGLRPAFRAMGERLAGEGYVVLVPNPFYRTKKGALLTPEEMPGQLQLRRRPAKPHTSAIATARHDQRRNRLARLPRRPVVRVEEGQARRQRLLHGRPACRPGFGPPP